MSESSKTILIASSGLDEEAWRPVADKLSARNFSVFAYEADKVADGRIGLDIKVEDAKLKVRYDGQDLALESMAAAWYRRPNIFSLEQDKDKARQMCLDVERRAIQYSLWDSVPEHAWLNAPRRVTHAEHKLTQLVLAQELGFIVPETVVSNRWSPIKESLPESVIYKPAYALFYSEDQMKLLYTTPFTNPSGLPTEGNPYPGFWQGYVPKSREWRVTVVGDETFDATIYTDASAKDDWRRHQLEAKVEFKRGSFPDQQKEKCFQYLGRLGLRFGAFDFVEGDDGQITFLECNANGQYGWLEDELGFPISDAITNELSRIAQSA